MKSIGINLKGLCIDVILGKSVDMSLVNIGNVYFVDISKQTHFSFGQPAVFSAVYKQRIVSTCYISVQLKTSIHQ